MTAPHPLHPTIDAGPTPRASCVFCGTTTGILGHLAHLFACGRCHALLGGQLRDARQSALHAVEPAVERVKLRAVR